MRASSPRRVETEAIVLKRYEWSETSRIVHLLTPRLGRVPAVARGIHRATSPMRGVLDQLCRVRVLLRFDESREIQNLDSAELLDHHPGVRKGLGLWYAALYAAELVDYAAQPSETSEGLYESFASVLHALSAMPRDATAVLMVFELAFLESIGLRPAFTACASCGTAIDPSRNRTALFSAAAGGIVCGACRTAGSRGEQEFEGSRRDAWLKVGTGSLRWCENALETGEAPSIPEKSRIEIRRMLDGFLEYHLERRPKVRSFLRIE